MNSDELAIRSAVEKLVSEGFMPEPEDEISVTLDDLIEPCVNHKIESPSKMLAGNSQCDSVGHIGKVFGVD